MNKDISIHTPAKGVTRPPTHKVGQTGNFNPHSREGSDARAKPAIPHTPISIHTPAKGVTGVEPEGDPATFISIHTPAKGVTLCYIHI